MNALANPEVGKFVNEIQIVVPPRSVEAANATAASKLAAIFEVQELKVELGQQVQAGQVLCSIANHQILAVEGRAFRDETPLRRSGDTWPSSKDRRPDGAGGRSIRAAAD